MSTRDIRTSSATSACEVCGRTLLRGERAEVYLNGGARKSVCELCKPRALHEGWVREGTLPAYDDAGSGPEGRRSLFGRLRARREAAAASSPTLHDELDGQSWTENRAENRPENRLENGRARDQAREPRHVRAVPTSTEQKSASAIELFNGSEYRRTVSGVSRSLGEPAVSVAPSAERPSLVSVVVSWELCWYRYEVDLSDDQPSVRVAAQGYELDELAAEERRPNAAADEHGSLSLSS